MQQFPMDLSLLTSAATQRRFCQQAAKLWFFDLPCWRQIGLRRTGPWLDWTVDSW